MNIEIVYYQSPVGILEIRSNGAAISDILFVNSWKGAKLVESKLSFTKPNVEKITIEADLHKDLKASLQQLTKWKKKK